MSHRYPWQLSSIWLVATIACGPTGSQWAQQTSARSSPAEQEPSSFQPPESRATSRAANSSGTKTIQPSSTLEPPVEPGGKSASKPTIALAATGKPAVSKETESTGQYLGKFRNTFYNFPAEVDHHGPLTTVFDAQCGPISRVPQAFHDRLCVQGSGQLRSGQTVSFAKRDCSCARMCPRTDQKICYSALDPERFPWGRGAMGTAIVPLRTVAVDSDEVPLGSSLYLPAFVGLPLNLDGSGHHDGCFVAADRGIRVRGKHVDVFAGSEAMTKKFNQLVPSNRGVEVYLDSPHCKATP